MCLSVCFSIFSWRFTSTHHPLQSLFLSLRFCCCCLSSVQTWIFTFLSLLNNVCVTIFSLFVDGYCNLLLSFGVGCIVSNLSVKICSQFSSRHWKSFRKGRDQTRTTPRTMNKKSKMTYCKVEHRLFDFRTFFSYSGVHRTSSAAAKGALFSVYFRDFTFFHAKPFTTPIIDP